MIASKQVLLVEDHPLLRSGLRSLIGQMPGLQVIGETGEGAVAVDLWRKYSPDLVVLDLHLADCNGLELVGRMRDSGKAARILVVSFDSTAATVSAAIAAGVHGFFLKAEPIAELEKAIRTLLAGQMYLSPGVVPIALGLATGPDADPSLTVLSPREREVLRLLAMGRRTKEVANELGVTVKTAETFRRRLIRKLGLHSVADLTRYAIRQGVVAP